MPSSWSRMRIERQQHDPVRRPRSNRGAASSLNGGQQRIATNTRASCRARQRGFQRTGLRLRLLQDRRAPTDLRIDLARNRRSPPRNEPRHGPPGRRKRNDGRIGKQIREKGSTASRQSGPPRLNRTTASFTAVALHARPSHSTCATGVSGRTPWPRLKMNGRPAHRRQDRSIAAVNAWPPAISAIGSRLPCTTEPSSACPIRHGAAVSIETASTPVSRRSVHTLPRSWPGETQ